MSEIIIIFKNKELQDEFIGQMMDGIGENFCDFSHWHKENGQYLKKYDTQNRLICTVNEIFEDND